MTAITRARTAGSPAWLASIGSEEVDLGAGVRADAEIIRDEKGIASDE